MAGQIYKSWRHEPTEAWHQLSKEAQEDLLAKVNEALEKVGGKRLVLCDSRWASEEWNAFGVEVFPDIEAVQKHAELLKALNWSRYGKNSTLLGTEWQPPS